MTPARFIKITDGFFRTHAEAAEFLFCGERSIRRWRSGSFPVPPLVALLLEIMIAANITPEQAKRILADRGRAPTGEPSWLDLK